MDRSLSRRPLARLRPGRTRSLACKLRNCREISTECRGGPKLGPAKSDQISIVWTASPYSRSREDIIFSREDHLGTGRRRSVLQSNANVGSSVRPCRLCHEIAARWRGGICRIALFPARNSLLFDDMAAKIPDAGLLEAPAREVTPQHRVAYLPHAVALGTLAMIAASGRPYERHQVSFPKIPSGLGVASSARIIA
jgi:hypothetical protein